MARPSALSVGTFGFAGSLGAAGSSVDSLSVGTFGWAVNIGQPFPPGPGGGGFVAEGTFRRPGIRFEEEPRRVRDDEEALVLLAWALGLRPS